MKRFLTHGLVLASLFALIGITPSDMNDPTPLPPIVRQIIQLL